ncbi:MAG: ribulose-phosphate 3-epimerase [Bacteroidales bacterium]|nr:ribulose-phosphate 3-epimerase [Bacteroidales bacterium]
MIVAPSMLSADFGNLKRDVEMVNESEAGLFHLDIMDGVFVPNISYGFPVVKSIAKAARKPMDAHLMIVDPDRYVSQFADMGVEYLSVHYEACTHLHRSLTNIRNLGMKAGVALNPHTNVQLIEDVLDCCDFVLIMSVNPGFGGQSFIPRAVEKVRQLKAMIQAQGLNTLIEVDGGVNFENVKVLAEAGADIVVAGSTVFSAPDPTEAISRLTYLK